MEKRKAAGRTKATVMLALILMLVYWTFSVTAFAQEYESIRMESQLASTPTERFTLVAKENINGTTTNGASTDTQISDTADEEKPSLAERLANKLGDLPDEAVCFVVSMIPVIELRGGLIVAAIKGLPLWKAVVVCIAGNLVPIPFILLLITPIFAWLKKTKFFRPIVEKLEKKSMGKSEKIQKYEFVGLLLFVGIPLPGTGAWTGSLIASLLEIKIKKAFPAICLGLVMATVIMCFISYGIPWLISNVF